MKKFFTGLSPLVRGIIIIVVLVIIAFLIYQLYQYLKNKPNREVVTDSQKELKRLATLGILPSFPDAIYQGSANAIATLLDGCETDDTERDVIQEVQKTVKNQADWYKLVIAFGTRDVSDCGSFGALSTNYDLVSLLKDQLDTFLVAPEFSESKNVLTKYLSTIGISF